MIKRYKEQSIGFFRKFLLMLAVVIVGFMGGSSLTVLYARAIPGVDYPYDPANYYSPTSISWADSAPSTFALRDLAGQGGAVYDYTRHMKSILYYQKFSEWNKLIQERLGLDLSMLVHSDEASKEQIAEKYAMYANQIANTKSSNMTSLPESMTSDYIDDRNYSKFHQQATYLDSSYKNSLVATQQNVNNAQDIYNALQEALERNYNAQSKMQVAEAQEQIKALEVMSKSILSNMLAEQSKIRAAQNSYDNTLQMEYLNQSINHSVRSFLNPYDEQDLKMLEELEKHTDFKVYHSKGMPDF